jgi:wyosine [tRNA(Phe)-imidazoG37] synthetase (radical SAM superfamily)
MQIKRQSFYKPEEILQSVEEKLLEVERKKEKIDYITFVPDGEPTLDINLGEEIKRLKKIGIKIAVITNTSLIGRDNVMYDLLLSDWVSIKVDAISEDIWRKINRPHGSLKLDEILSGIFEFSRFFSGELVTETMLIKELNSRPDELIKIADFISRIHPSKSYLSIPTRPPAEKWVQPADESDISVAYSLFTERSIDTEYLIGYEGNAFAFTGNFEKDLLSITSVHPMRRDAVEEYLKNADSDWKAVEKLIDEEKLMEVSYKENRFYVRKFHVE